MPFSSSHSVVCLLATAVALSACGSDSQKSNNAGAGGATSGFGGGSGAGGPGAGGSAGGSGVGSSGRGGTSAAGSTGGSAAGSTGGSAGAGASTGGSGGAGGGTSGCGAVSLKSLEPNGVFGPGNAGSMPSVDTHIVVDQFGYLPDSEKIAVIRNPETGFDANNPFSPGSSYALVSAMSGAKVKTGPLTAWKAGAKDPSSGDHAWWFDFSDVKAAGDYYVLDVDKNVRSYVFRVSDTAYQDVLKQAVRMFFYQRVGQDKDAAHAGTGWVDRASYVGPLQDHNCRLYSDPNNAATEKDIWGGWYDAGDLNKYTIWTAGYVEELLRSYVENPSVWTDDYNIPESGNGVPDVLDEAKWGMDYLTRLQGEDGSVLSIVGEASGSPPSSATGQSLYGSPSTASALSAAAAFAYGARVYKSACGGKMATYADDLLARAKKAWSFAQANPNLKFYNNDSAHGTSGLGAGQQQPDDWSMIQIDAAVQLFATTQDSEYRAYVDANYTKAPMMKGNVGEWDTQSHDALLDYASATGATSAAAAAIKNAYLNGVKGAGNLGRVLAIPAPDPYMAWLDAYTWGSNQIKGAFGNLFYDIVARHLDPATDADARRAAERYIHYLHGVNPLALVYLSNMNDHGAERSVTQFFHTWFADGSAKWDQVGVSTYGPPPGYLVGGPNPSYDWAGCCPSGCGTGVNEQCTAESVSPPKGQPDQKSYKDFNAGWPLGSWSVTEPSDGYQVKYIRLLSKFVR